VKVGKRSRKIRAEALKTNRIGCGCALVLLVGLILTMLIAAYRAIPH